MLSGQIQPLFPEEAKHKERPLGWRHRSHGAGFMDREVQKIKSVAEFSGNAGFKWLKIKLNGNIFIAGFLL